MKRYKLTDGKDEERHHYGQPQTAADQ